MAKAQKRATAVLPVTAKIIRPKQWRPTKPLRRKINLRTPVGKINKHWVTVEHKEDPRQALLTRIGEVPKDLVQFSRMLVAIYQPPMVEKSGGGIILTDGMSEEDRDEYVWQGKVGLIVAMGQQAYTDDDTFKFHGVANQVGDWVWFMPSNGQGCEVNEVPCRLFESERFINGRIPNPDLVW